MAIGVHPSSHSAIWSQSSIAAGVCPTGEVCCWQEARRHSNRLIITCAYSCPLCQTYICMSFPMSFALSYSRLPREVLLAACSRTSQSRRKLPAISLDPPCQSLHDFLAPAVSLRCVSSGGFCPLFFHCYCCCRPSDSWMVLG